MKKKTKKQSAEFIDLFCNFVNRDIDEISLETIGDVGLEYIRLLFYSKGNEDLTLYKSKYELFTSVALTRSEKKLNEVKKHFKSVQSSLLKVLTELIEETTPTPVKQKGTREIVVVDDKFKENFITKDVPLNKFDRASEKQKIEALFFDCLMNESLIPSRFKRCQNRWERRECNNLFYQFPSGRKQKYCSSNCSSAVRQRNKNKN